MSAAVVALLNLIVSVAGSTSDAAVIANIIATLETIISTGTELIEAEIPIIENIIGALQANSSITPEQLTQLQASEAALDAAFEAAASAAGAPTTGS
jgi:hypothetical protein